MDSDDDEMCWKSMMAIAPRAAAMASGSEDVAARPLAASPLAAPSLVAELHV